MTNLTRKVSLIGKRVCAAVLAGISTIGHTEAQTVWNGKVFGDWQYECAPLAKEITQCALVQSIIDTGSFDPLLRLSFARSSVDETVIASVLLPLGVELEEGVRLHFGRRNAWLPFKTCVIEGCLSRKIMSHKDLLQLAREENFTVAFYAVGRLAVVKIPASSRGLMEAFQSLGFVVIE